MNGSSQQITAYPKFSSGETHLPFFELGVTPGVTMNYLSRSVNASSLGITIPGGFAIGTTNQTLAYVCASLPANMV